MKFSGGSAYTLSPHITVAKLLSVSSWLAGTVQADIWEMCLVNLAQPGNTAAQCRTELGLNKHRVVQGHRDFFTLLAGLGAAPGL